MKNRILIVVLSLFVSSSIVSQSWTKGSIKGEGDIVKKELNIDPFNGVSLGFSGDIILTQGSRQKVVAEGQANVIDNIKTNVKNGIWRVNFEKNVKNAKKVTVYITMPTLQHAGLAGSGNLRTASKFSGLSDINVGLSGSGNLALEFDSSGEVDCGLAGSGNIVLAGSASALEIGVSGSGNVKAEDLEVGDCHIGISGSGNCKVNVKNNLEVGISGSGDVHYRGDCNVKSKISGSGDVRSM